MATVAASIALGVFVLFAALNLYIVVRDWKAEQEGKTHQSTIPLIGGIAGALGCLGFEMLQPYAWAPLVLDIGTPAFLLFRLPAIAKEKWQTSSLNLLRAFSATDGRTKTATLRLYRSGTFVLRLNFQREQNERGIMQFTRTGIWRETAAGIALATHDEKHAEMSWRNSAIPAILEVTTDFPTFQADAELALAGLAFTEVTGSA